MKKYDEVKYNKLVKKYFWEQKFKEVGWGILGISAFIFIPYWVGKLLPSAEGEDAIGIWLPGLLVTALCGFVLLFIGWMISEWIKENWRKARWRARLELGIK